ncbi:histone methyltransferase set2 [Marasmius tenuissimus]|nr:histone methyltransferase set2 [Marasmius tenuissimus]
MSVKSQSRSPSPLLTDTDEHKYNGNGVGADESESLPNSASSSKTSTPPPTAASTSRKSQKAPPQLIGHLPIARDEALGTFTEMPDNWYQYKSLGRSRELMESMTCECQFIPGDDPDTACGHNSDCINRLTQVECLPDDCRCGDYCQNQRFRKKEYAPIEIVKTEMKGYGLRVEEDLEKDSFIYEYVGDVVNTQSFKKRMRDYANEGIEHFYFMMLQKDEFIDATKNGGIGRFANHSCNPNCYVAKWTVGKTVRMGIYSKRKIKQYEELTFNYNVDRYGHQAQTCYCGEPNCVGFIGGKTQTDVSSMDDLYLDALGITDEDELMEMKGTKKKKGKKIDDPDFMPQMKSIVEKEVPKVVQALRQVQSKKVLYKLLTRIKITEDAPPLRQIMRLRGFSIMKNILEDYAQDLDIISIVLQCMRSWPLVARNKVEDSQVLGSVQELKESDDPEVKEHATGLYEHWQSLEMAYRIPKRTQSEIEEEKKRLALQEKIQTDNEHWADIRSSRDYAKRPRFIDVDDKGKPIGNSWPYRRPRSSFRPPPPPLPPTPASPPVIGLSAIEQHIEKQKQQNAAVNSLIAAVAEERAAAEAAAAEQARLAAARAEADALIQSSRNGSSEPVHSSKKKDRGKEKEKSKDKTKDKKKPSQSEAEREANKEKRLQKLVGAIVVKCMSKYAKDIEHELFKKYAKELTEKIAEREKKSSSYKEGKLDTLSDEKTAKIKKYAKEYITNKILRKVGKSGSGRRPSSSKSLSIKPEPSDGTPNSVDLPSNMADLEMDEGEGDADMDMDHDSDSEAEDETSAHIKVENGEPELHGKQNGFGATPIRESSMDIDTPFVKKEEPLELGMDTWGQRPRNGS